jgi:hypothetical protein
MRLEETINFAGAEFVEEAGQKIVKNVAMLGPVSSHGYEYEQPAIAKAVSNGLYEGVRIFINHSPGSRDLMDLAGVFKNTRHEGGKVRGNAHLLPDEYGLVTKNGKQVVEEISRVYSVDLVVQGATTQSVFEGTDTTNLPSPGDSRIPVPKPGEKQYQFIAHCLRDVKAGNKTLTDSEAGAICFTSWQTRFEAAGGVDTGTGQDIMPKGPEEPKPEADQTSTNKGGNKPPERESPMNNFEQLEKQMAEADRYLSRDPAFEEISKREGRLIAEARHQEHQQARITEAQIGAASTVLDLDGKRETDAEFWERRKQEAAKRATTVSPVFILG